jgi:hypothetical protein
MNADHEEAVEFAKISKRENRVYVGNLSYDVRYKDLIEFMRGGGWGIIFSLFSVSSCCGHSECAAAVGRASCCCCCCWPVSFPRLLAGGGEGCLMTMARSFFFLSSTSGSVSLWCG